MAAPLHFTDQVNQMWNVMIAHENHLTKRWGPVAAKAICQAAMNFLVVNETFMTAGQRDDWVRHASKLDFNDSLLQASNHKFIKRAIPANAELEPWEVAQLSLLFSINAVKRCKVKLPAGSNFGYNDAVSIPAQPAGLKQWINTHNRQVRTRLNRERESRLRAEAHGVRMQAAQMVIRKVAEQRGLSVTAPSREALAEQWRSGLRRAILNERKASRRLVVFACLRALGKPVSTDMTHSLDQMKEAFRRQHEIQQQSVESNEQQPRGSQVTCKRPRSASPEAAAPALTERKRQRRLSPETESQLSGDSAMPAVMNPTAQEPCGTEISQPQQSDATEAEGLHIPKLEDAEFSFSSLQAAQRQPTPLRSPSSSPSLFLSQDDDYENQMMQSPEPVFDSESDTFFSGDDGLSLQEAVATPAIGHTYSRPERPRTPTLMASTLYGLTISLSTLDSEMRASLQNLAG